jgi:altronate dehydratase
MSVAPVPSHAAPRDALLLTPSDDVATALRPLGTGQQAHVEGLKQTLLIRQVIPLCHKVACRDIAMGESVRKYGEVIGVATVAIQAGTHVHVHNLKSQRS